MWLIDHEKLTAAIAAICVAGGTEPELADIVAGHLVEANLKGHDSHGVGMIPTYIGSLRIGNLDPNAHASIEVDKPSILRINGNTGYGQVVGREATELGIERAREHGLACVALRNSFHLGRIGTYGEMCAAAGLVSVHFVNVVGHEPQVSPWGGRERRMTTNPFCCVVPQSGGEPVILDMATSAIALGKVRVAYNQGVDVPAGALVDHEGQPTTNPAVMYEEPFGALGPFGEHKGYGLAVMCELLGGALAGNWTAQPEHERKGTVVNNMLAVIIDPAAIGDAAGFEAEAAKMIEYLHSTTPAAGFDDVLVPGDPERRSMAARKAAGVPVDETTWEGILRAAGMVDMSRDSVNGIAEPRAAG